MLPKGKWICEKSGIGIPVRSVKQDEKIFFVNFIDIGTGSVKA
jgi:hypothetical protein